MSGSTTHGSGGEGASLARSLHPWYARNPQAHASRLGCGAFSSENVSALRLKTVGLNGDDGSLYDIWPNGGFEDGWEANLAHFFTFEVKNLG